jgi:hypothetical protein
MNKFGKYALIQPRRYYFRDEPELWWEVRPPTAGDELALTRFINQGKVTASSEGLTQEEVPTWLDIIFWQVARLFAGTNIPANPDEPVSEGGEPFVKESEPYNIVEEKLQSMPWDMVSEVADAIAEFVPGWGPKNPLSRTKEEEETTS